MNKIKILLITNEYSEKFAGGAGVYALELSQHIAKSGIEIHVLAPDIYSHDKVLCDNLFVHYKKTIFKPLLRMPSYSFQVWKSWRGLVNKYKITSIHSNNNAGVWVNNIPIISVIHHPAIRESQQFSFFQKILNILDITLEKVNVNKSKIILSVCNTTYKELLEIYPEIKKKLTLIPVGLDFSKYQAIPRSNNSIYTIFFPGGARSKRKGAEYLFPAIEKLKKVLNFKLIISGNSREIGWKNKFNALIKKHMLEKHIVLLGEVSYDKIVNIYNESDLVVFPSTYEGYGIPVLEALAMSKPLIATKTGEAINIIKHESNGMLVNTFDSNSIYNAIYKLITNIKLTQKIQQNARDSVIDSYSWNLVAQKTINLHRQLI
jgi:glycosyltransferase involved in cell wall biosynthesis